jgi:tRNA dimethylallyltransferase
MQVYRFMDIGTAKPTRAERAAVNHYLIDVVRPDEEFNASMFADLASRAIRDIHAGDRAVFVAGGTGLYLRVLTGGLLRAPGADPDLRRRYREEILRHGNEYLYEKLRQVDREAAETIRPNDAVRIIRALEIMESTGESIVGLRRRHGFGARPYRYLKIGLLADRSALNRRIDARCDDMVRLGLAEETEKLLGMGFGEDLKPMNSFSYRHMTGYVLGRLALPEAVELMKRDTRHFAKRQWTWFKGEKDIDWRDPSDSDRISDEIRAFLEA